ncbi:MAG: hypothetical protein J4N29_04005 [Chloroflexi bacterium]|nr:hypothetical protein [Chloroflexota bacterium]MCI0816194.1 hypothetical protein [Chloroflexota bacterium]
MSTPPTARGVRHYAVIFLAFGVTGGLTVFLSRLLLNELLGLDGSLLSGPWSYRLIYLALIPPVYSATLMAVGTLMGKRAFFQRRVVRLWGWALPASLKR